MNLFPQKTTHRRFWEKVSGGDGGCWEWAGCKSKQGYGKFSIPLGPYGAKRNKWVLVYAHRYAYEELKGAITGGLVIDHLCRNTSCVNPHHMEAVTNRENTIRGFGPAARHSRETHCLRGHALDRDNLAACATRPRARICLICQRARLKSWRKSKKEARNGLQ